MAPVGVSFSLLMCYNDHISEAKDLVEVSSSAILDPCGSHQFMSCPCAISFFQRLCPAPFLPVSFLLTEFLENALKSATILASTR